MRDEDKTPLQVQIERAEHAEARLRRLSNALYYHRAPTIKVEAIRRLLRDG